MNFNGLIADRYRVSDPADLKGIGRAPRLVRSIGEDDGEHYLLRLYPKSSRAIDADLKGLLAESLRRFRRVLAVGATREVFVEAVEVVEDDAFIGIVMLEAGRALSELSARSWQVFRDAARSNGARAKLWFGIERVAVALDACHGAGIVHGAVGHQTVFVDDSSLAFRLGGYETAVSLGDPDSALQWNNHGRSQSVSFHRDWAELGLLVGDLFDMANENPPILIAAEHRLLDRLSRPKRFQNLDGKVVIEDIREVVKELERIGSSAQGELICYPDRRVLASNLGTILHGAIPIDDTNRLLEFATQDLSEATTRIAAYTPRGCDVLLITQRATYKLQIIDDHIARIVSARSRQASDRVEGSLELLQKVKVCFNRREAEDRRRRLGLGAASWRSTSSDLGESALSDDSPVWHALLIIEVFTLLSQEFSVYPVSVDEADDGNTLIVYSREDQARDHKRSKLGLLPASEAMVRELSFDDGSKPWTVSEIDPISPGLTSLPSLTFQGKSQISGQTAFIFEVDVPIRQRMPRFLRLKPDVGTERAVARRLSAIVSARGQDELLDALNDPRRIVIDPMMREVAAPGPAPEELDASKADAWRAISEGGALRLIVGPPGVGKTFFVTRLIQSVLQVTPDAKVLVSAQNHEALALMERETKTLLSAEHRIVVRSPSSGVSPDETDFRQNSRSLLRAMGKHEQSPLTEPQRQWICDALRQRSTAENSEADVILRDTDHLVLRSADVTLATTNSARIEELISEGTQFDWVIVEEAARATGPELIGPLLLGNRRLVIGDHRQLPPFDAEQRARLYEPEAAAVLLQDAIETVASFPGVPPEVKESLTQLQENPQLLGDVLGIAARLEEPFRAIVEQNEEDSNRTTMGPVSRLLEQRRMHPAICELVSRVFYDGKLVSASGLADRPDVINARRPDLSAPLIVADLPALSTISMESYERRSGPSRVNDAEATAVISVLRELSPSSEFKTSGRKPTLAVLSPYSGQVDLLKRELAKLDKDEPSGLAGFVSAKGDGEFVHTVDGFQGGEADLVIVSLVRNNAKVGRGAVGFLRAKQRLNVLLSRARHKLVLVTSRQFIRDAVNGIDPDRLGHGDLGFLRAMVETIDDLVATRQSDGRMGASIVSMDELGGFR